MQRFENISIQRNNHAPSRKNFLKNPAAQFLGAEADSIAEPLEK